MICVFCKIIENEKDKNNINSFMQDEMDRCNEVLKKYQNI